MAVQNTLYYISFTYASSNIFTQIQISLIFPIFIQKKEKKFKPDQATLILLRFGVIYIYNLKMECSYCSRVAWNLTRISAL